MKHLSKVLAVVFGLLMAVSAFAADKNSVNLTVMHKSTVSGTTLDPGEYKVVFNRTGDTVQATFLSGKKTVATTSGHFEQRSTFPSSVSLVVNSDRAVQAIVVQKLGGAVVLEGEASSSAGH
ncbi:MAG TPA: hypothetical protein VGL89_04265 [Candidatus Koribacter sp.]|jgi:hypothetical protein